jgi:hypothetical protein
MPGKIPKPSGLDRVYKALTHPGVEIPLYGALAAGEIDHAVEERKKGKSGLLPALGAGALGLMAAPHVVDLVRMLRGKTASSTPVIEHLKSIL